MAKFRDKILGLPFWLWNIWILAMVNTIPMVEVGFNDKK